MGRLEQTIAELEQTIDDCHRAHAKQTVTAEGKTAEREFDFFKAMRAMLALLDVLQHGGNEAAAIAQAEAVIARARWHWKRPKRRKPRRPQRAGPPVYQQAGQRRGTGGGRLLYTRGILGETIPHKSEAPEGGCKSLRHRHP